MELSRREQQIVVALLAGHTSLSALLRRPILGDITERTLQRALLDLIQKGLVRRDGEARARVYHVTPQGTLQVVFSEDELETIFADDMRQPVQYDFERLAFLKTTPLFTKEEFERLEHYNAIFLEKLRSAPPDIIKRERERITIELSWKSSQIEGNTYTLLETESLIKEGVPALGRSHTETTMVLNHKKALDFSETHRALFAAPLTSQVIIELHRILADGIMSEGIRERFVGITGSVYRPLSTKFQIQDELVRFCDVLNVKENVFEKALLAFVYICYLQPFNDGNKRTARILANAILFAHDSFPLSLRAVDVNTYKRAILAFYELASLGNAKSVFVDQARFASENYAI